MISSFIANVNNYLLYWMIWRTLFLKYKNVFIFIIIHLFFFFFFFFLLLPLLYKFFSSIIGLVLAKTKIVTKICQLYKAHRLEYEYALFIKNSSIYYSHFYIYMFHVFDIFSKDMHIFTSYFITINTKD